MADHGGLEFAAAAGNDYVAHEQTYRSFVALAKATHGRHRHPDGNLPDLIQRRWPG